MCARPLKLWPSRRNVDKDPSGDKTGQGSGPRLWLETKASSIDRESGAMSKSGYVAGGGVFLAYTPPLLGVFARMSPHRSEGSQWLGSRRRSPMAKSWNRRAGQRGCRDRCDRFKALPTNTGQRPRGDGVLPEADPLTRPALATGIVNHNGDNVMAKDPPPSPPAPDPDVGSIGRRDASRGGGGGSFASSGAKTCLKGPEILLVV